MASGEVIREPWVGFIHEMPAHERSFLDLNRLLALDTWKASVGSCKGLWVLSDYLKEYLVSRDVAFPVASLYYPVDFSPKRFDFDRFAARSPRRLVFVGEYLRNVRPFFDLNVPDYERLLLRLPELDLSSIPPQVLSEVTIAQRVSDSVYDSLLAECVVFLNLIDAGANTTIV